MLSLYLQGQLIGVIGKVGSGKSSLLSAITAEMDKTRGQVIFYTLQVHCLIFYFYFILCTWHIIFTFFFCQVFVANLEMGFGMACQVKCTFHFILYSIEAKLLRDSMCALPAFLSAFTLVLG